MNTAPVEHPPHISYITGAELPGVDIWWTDSACDLIDFSSGWTFLVEVGLLYRPAVVSKTTGITGAAGSGTPGNGVPNLVIEWDDGELDGLAPAEWVVEVTAVRTSDGKDRKAHIAMTIRPQILALVP